MFTNNVEFVSCAVFNASYFARASKWTDTQHVSVVSSHTGDTTPVVESTPMQEIPAETSAPEPGNEELLTLTVAIRGDGHIFHADKTDRKYLKRLITSDEMRNEKKWRIIIAQVHKYRRACKVRLIVGYDEYTKEFSYQEMTIHPVNNGSSTTAPEVIEQPTSVAPAPIPEALAPEPVSVPQVQHKPEGKQVFTTGEVAKICQVAPRTVSMWFDRGKIKGYRIPGSQDRRIPRAALETFIREHGFTPSCEF